MNKFKNYVSSKMAYLGIGAIGLGLLVLLASVGRLIFNTSLHTSDAAAGPGAVARANVEAAYGKLPLRFEVNQGQTDEQVKFLARGSGYSLYLTAAEAVLRLRHNRNAKSVATLRMKMAGAKMKPRVAGVDELSGVSNYYIGNDPRKWLTGVPSYSKVKYEQIYPGIDMVYYGSDQAHLEYDFIVGASADPATIKMAFEGADKLEVDGDGGLRLHVAGNQLQLRKPVLYQEKDGIRQEIAGSYVLSSSSEVGFQVAAYDTTRPLIIDPVLVYSTFLGGARYDAGLSIAVNPHGNAFITGKTASLDFPTQPNPSQIGPGGGFDAFVTEMNVSGSQLVYSTYLGGSADENDQGGMANYGGIAIDSAGNAYVTGLTTSADFPTPGGQPPVNNGFVADAFVTKLNASGSLVYSTCIGGRGFDAGHAIAVDSLGQAYITGQEESGTLPVNGFQPVHAAGCQSGFKDGFVAKLNAAGSQLLYSTYFGGNSCNIGFGIAVDADQNAYVTGETLSSSNFAITPGAFDTTCGTDGACNPINNVPISDAFVTKIDTKITGPASLKYGAYLGGSSDERFVYTGGPGGIAIDPAAKFIYLTGNTASADFPVTNGSLKNGIGDAFVTKIDTSQPATLQLVYSTYLGGSGNDVGTGVAVDINGNAYVTGSGSGDFPVTPGMSACSDQGAFVVKMGPAGSVKYAACLSGNSDNDTAFSIAIDPSGCAYVTGATSSSDFPVLNPFQITFAGGGIPPSDAFVTKICDGLDHFKCYDVQPPTNFKPFTAKLRDQFEEQDVTVLQPVSLCNPVVKCLNGDCTPLLNPDDHLVCYETIDERGTPEFEKREVEVSNQFGQHQRLTVLRRKNLLCLPSLKAHLNGKH
jgi:hypothetical protein